VTSGTLFSHYKLPLQVYLGAIAIYTNAVKGLSALQLSRDLDCAADGMPPRSKAGSNSRIVASRRPNSSASRCNSRRQCSTSPASSPRLATSPLSTGDSAMTPTPREIGERQILPAGPGQSHVQLLHNAAFFRSPVLAPYVRAPRTVPLTHPDSTSTHRGGTRMHRWTVNPGRVKIPVPEFGSLVADQPTDQRSG
jgi:hypothetical protein